MKTLRLAKRAETLRKKRKKLARISIPTIQIFKKPACPQPKGNMESAKEEVGKFLEKAHSDPERYETRNALKI